MEAVVVSRHPAMLDYLIEEGWVQPGTPFVTKAQPNDVRGKHVFGVVPMWLAAETELLTEVVVHTPWEWRGQVNELTVEQIRTYVRDPVTYEIKVIPFDEPFDEPEEYEGDDLPWEA